MSERSDLKAPARKTPRTGTSAASRAHKARVIQEEEKSTPSIRFMATLALCVLLGGAAMYFIMPMFQKPQGGMTQGAAGGPPAGGPPGAAMALPVEGVPASRIMMAQTLTVTATLKANESAVIKPEVAGRITEIPFTEGAPVKKGDILFKMDDSVQKAALAQAQATVSLARNNVKRYKDLAGTRAVAKVQVEEAQAELNTSSANVALAKANIDKMTIRAPFDGVAGIRDVSVGDVVDPSMSLVSVTQTTPLRVIFDVPERFLSVVEKDQIVKFNVASKPGQQYEATIVARDSMIDPVTRAVRVQAIVPNDDGALLSGQFATLRFALNAPANVLAVPDSAIIPEGGAFSVFKVGQKGMVEKVSVKLGLRDGQNVEIIEGLKEGEQVVTAGQQKIFPGMPVKISPPSKITASPPPEEETAD